MAEKLTPMMRQYRDIKRELPDDVIVFFRLGDFFEIFFRDAQVTAPILGIALTKRHEMPMCGIPHHALNGYLAKMIRAGKKVAICDQVEDPAQAKGIVKRAVTRIVTPGTVIEENILENNRHNFLAGVHRVAGQFGVAFIDISTGTFWGETAADIDQLRDCLQRYAPSECLVSESLCADGGVRAVVREACFGHLTLCDDWIFGHEAAYESLTRHLDIHSLRGYGCEDLPAVIGAAGGTLQYVRDDLHLQVGHVRGFRVRVAESYLMMDEGTSRNLDLVPVPGARDNGVSLLKILDVTKTPMGGRHLRDWILRPLADYTGILERHDAVAWLVDNRSILAELRETLARVRDLERLMSRMSGGSANGRDIQAVSISLAALPDVRELVLESGAALLDHQSESLSPLPELVDFIQRAVVDEPPATIKDGGLVRDGYSEDLDGLRHAASQGRQWLAEYQAAEMERTGIKNLKVRHNKVFGYYIEVSKANLANVPDAYVRKQTLVNAERFITPELKEYESTILGAHDRAVALEYDIFCELREAVVGETARIQDAADALATLDVLASLADRALALRYVRPTMYDDDRLHIVKGRHPVIEQMVDGERFVPNDAFLNGSSDQLMIITGPNMAGKSTYIRQVAVIVLMAQLGSFVPAESAEVGVVDRVFTRVGASDDLARGRSTFMVEMQETANILNNATPRSLVVLDEIGRGTSTFDGISIAWAVAEHLHNCADVKAKTLFATHYHELTDLALTMDGVKNYNVLVREKDDRIVFLRRIVPGGADKSYGIQVARLAGMPQSVVDRSKEILVNLEEGEFEEPGRPKIAKHRRRPAGYMANQLNLFEG